MTIRPINPSHFRPEHVALGAVAAGTAALAAHRALRGCARARASHEARARSALPEVRTTEDRFERAGPPVEILPGEQPPSRSGRRPAEFWELLRMGLPLDAFEIPDPEEAGAAGDVGESAENGALAENGAPAANAHVLETGPSQAAAPWAAPGSPLAARIASSAAAQAPIAVAAPDLETTLGPLPAFDPAVLLPNVRAARFTLDAALRPGSWGAPLEKGRADRRLEFEVKPDTRLKMRAVMRRTRPADCEPELRIVGLRLDLSRPLTLANPLALTGFAHPDWFGRLARQAGALEIAGFNVAPDGKLEPRVRLLGPKNPMRGILGGEHLGGIGLGFLTDLLPRVELSAQKAFAGGFTSGAPLLAPDAAKVDVPGLLHSFGAMVDTGGFRLHIHGDAARVDTALHGIQVSAGQTAVELHTDATFNVSPTAQVSSKVTTSLSAGPPRSPKISSSIRMQADSQLKADGVEGHVKATIEARSRAPRRERAIAGARAEAPPLALEVRRRTVRGAQVPLAATRTPDLRITLPDPVMDLIERVHDTVFGVAHGDEVHYDLAARTRAQADFGFQVDARGPRVEGAAITSAIDISGTRVTGPNVVAKLAKGSRTTFAVERLDLDPSRLAAARARGRLEARIAEGTARVGSLTVRIAGERQPTVKVKLAVHASARDAGVTADYALDIPARPILPVAGWTAPVGMRIEREGRVTATREEGLKIDQTEQRVRPFI